MSGSFQQALRSSGIIGGASIINVAIGLLRTKAAALILGPAGIGLVGLFFNLMTVAVSVTSFGIGNVGTRQLAEAQDEQQLALARRALFWAAVALSATGSLIIVLLRHPLARFIFGDPARSGDVAWLAIGVGLTIAASAQNALLRGLRRIGDLARASIVSAVAGTVAGVGALLVWDEAGLIAYVLVSPVATVLAGAYYVSKLPRLTPSRLQPARMNAQWIVMARLGAAFMIGSLISTGGEMLVRTIIHHQLGPVPLGHFQAAWMISMNYIGFILASMATDYYPRLTAVVRDHEAVNRLANEQTEISLLLGAPVLVAMIGLAPWIIRILYSSQFTEAADILRWQILGDLAKIASWPLGFIFLAVGHGRKFVLTEAAAMATFVLLTAIGTRIIGIEASGVSFLGMYIVYLLLVLRLTRKITGFRWNRGAASAFALALAACVLTAAAAAASATAGALSGVVLSAALSWFALTRLGDALPHGLKKFLVIIPNSLKR